MEGDGPGGLRKHQSAYIPLRIIGATPTSGLPFISSSAPTSPMPIAMPSRAVMRCSLPVHHIQPATAAISSASGAIRKRPAPHGEEEKGPKPFPAIPAARRYRSEEHTSELQSLMRISYAVF